MSNFGVHIVLLAVVIALALTIAPEEPEWIQSDETTFTTNNNMARFVGGDGQTMLTGHWYYNGQSFADEKNKQQSLPVVILACGMGLAQSSGLMNFIDAFQSAGMAVFTFDYATFGQSDGFPRHLIHPESHVADIQAAIQMIQQLPHKEVDRMNLDIEKIGLWGTSLGGGHVLRAVASAKDSPVKAVVSQIPHLASGFESVVLGGLSRTPLIVLQGLSKFLLGLVRWSLYRMVGKPSYFPIVGAPGSAAMLQDPGDEQGYLEYLAPSPTNKIGWKNVAITISGLYIVFGYRPLNTVAAITNTPVLLVAAENDTLCPARYVQQASTMVEGSEFYMVPNAGHFDVYAGSKLEDMLEVETAFLKKHLFKKKCPP